ncbi:MAG TPA: hypothetical protein EYP53_10475 [Candidatus Latescibacteria bacterium]|nr:hypothetical protein [Candidatus Latescibacterota bacterium]
MTPRERMHRVLGKGQPDRVPVRYWAGLPEAVKAELIGSCADEKERMKKQQEMVNALPSIMSGVLRPVIEDDGNNYVQRCETGVIIRGRHKPAPFREFSNFPIKTAKDLDNFQMPEVNNPARYEGFRERVERYHQADCFIAAYCVGPFQGPTLFLREFTEFLMDFVQDLGFAKAIMEMYTEFILEDIRTRLELGADAVEMGDDLGSNDALFIHPQTFRELVKPLYARLIAAWKAIRPDVKVMLHCDGNINDIFEDLIEVGLDAVNRLDPADNMDITELKRNYGTQIALMGGFSRHLGQMGRKELRKHITEVMEAGKPGGAYIAEVGIHPEMALDDVRYVVEIVESLRDY